MRIPVARKTNWWVVCSACKTRLFSSVSAAELQGMSPDQLAEVVYRRISLVHKFLAVAALLLSVAPCLGVVMGLIAWVTNRKSPGWPKVLSTAGLAIAVVLQIAFVAFVLIGALSAARRAKPMRLPEPPRAARTMDRAEAVAATGRPVRSPKRPAEA